MYSLVKAMEFRHLPEAGGLYDQNPEFLDRMAFIMQEQSKWDAQEESRKKNQEMGPSKVPRKGSGRRRGR